MKRYYKIFALVLSVCLVLGLAGCGSSKASGAVNSSYAVDYAAPAAAPAMAEPSMAYEEAAMDLGAAKGLGGADSRTAQAKDMAEKIIYNGSANLETTEFDKAILAIDALVEENGGFLESSSISGSDYNSIASGYSGTRRASYTIRIPSESFNNVMGSLSDIGNVPYSETSTRNVTRDYYDVQARLDAYKTQEARLLEMLSVAESVEDMLAIQQQLTEVQYEIDSLTGTLRYYDNQVGYSTIYLHVQEVRKYTPETTVTLTYRERMEKGFKRSVENTVDFFREFFLWFVTSLPWLVPACLVLWLVVALLRRHRPERVQRRAERRAAKNAEKERRKAERRAKKQPDAPAPAEEKAPEPIVPVTRSDASEDDTSGQEGM